VSEQITRLTKIIPENISDEFIILQDDDPQCLATYRGYNADQRCYTVFRTDQGSANTEKRCDFLLFDSGRHLAWYIELKGKNHWDIACEQLLTTHMNFSPELNLPMENIYFRLVSSSLRTGTRAFRSYNSYRTLILNLPRNAKHFELMFSSRLGLHRDYEELASTTIIPQDEEIG